MRTPRRLMPITGLALLLAGCASGPAAIESPKGQSDKLVSGALSELAEHPFLSFTGTVDDFTSGDSAKISVGVTDSGLMYGTAEIADQKLRLLSVDGKYLVNADTAFWDGHGDNDSSEAERLGGDWTPVDPDEWFHPGAVLATGEFADALKKSLDEAKTADSWRPEPTEEYGRACHPFQVRDGTLCVSVDKPHRITYFDDVPVRYQAKSGERSAALDLELGDIDADGVESWAKDLTKAIKDLSPVYAYGGVSMSSSSDGFNCSGTTCTFAAKLGVEKLSKHQKVAKKVKIGFKGVAETGSGKTETCTASVTVKVGSSKTAKCSVTFNLSPGESQSVSASFESDGLMTFKPDTGDLAKAAKKDVKQVLDKL